MKKLSNEEFVEHVFRNCAPNAFPVFIAFGGDPAKVRRSAWRAIERVPCERGWVHGSRLNTFVGISTFYRAEDDEVHRRKRDFAGCHVIMLDDLGTKVPMSAIRGIPPTCLIETSSGNFQAWYALREPCTDEHVVRRFQDALVARGLGVDGVDPGMKGVTRVGRLPVGRNLKAKNGPAGWAHVTHVWSPKVLWSIDELASTRRGFGISFDPTPPRSRISVPRPKNLEAPLRDLFIEAGLYLHPTSSPHEHAVRCPWGDLHSDGRCDDGAYVYDATGETGWRDGFKCWHGSCGGQDGGSARAWFGLHADRGRVTDKKKTPCDEHGAKRGKVHQSQHSRGKR